MSDPESLGGAHRSPLRVPLDQIVGDHLAGSVPEAARRGFSGAWAGRAEALGAWRALLRGAVRAGGASLWGRCRARLHGPGDGAWEVAAVKVGSDAGMQPEPGRFPGVGIEVAHAGLGERPGPPHPPFLPALVADPRDAVEVRIMTHAELQVVPVSKVGNSCSDYPPTRRLHR